MALKYEFPYITKHSFGYLKKFFFKVNTILSSRALWKKTVDHIWSVGHSLETSALLQGWEHLFIYLVRGHLDIYNIIHEPYKIVNLRTSLL